MSAKRCPQYIISKRERFEQQAVVIDGGLHLGRLSVLSIITQTCYRLTDRYNRIA